MSVTKEEERTERVNWAEEDLHEWEGEKISIILEVERPNLNFKFGVPRSHNRIDEREAAFMQIHRKATGELHTTLLDRSELIDFQLGLALIMNEVLRDQDVVAVKREGSGREEKPPPEKGVSETA